MILAPGFLISCKTGICFTSLKMVSVGVGDELFPFLSGDVIYIYIRIYDIYIYMSAPAESLSSWREQ